MNQIHAGSLNVLNAGTSLSQIVVSMFAILFVFGIVTLIIYFLFITEREDDMEDIGAPKL